MTIFRKRLTAQDAANQLFEQHVSPDAIWLQVQNSGSVGVPDSVACCEVAFLRIACLKDCALRAWRPDVAAAFYGAVDDLVTQAFPDHGDGDTEVYYGKSLAAAAPEVVQMYVESCGYLESLAHTVARRLRASDESKVLAALNGYHEVLQGDVSAMRVKA